MPNTIFSFPVIEQEMALTPSASKWKRESKRADSKAPSLRVLMMERGSPDKAKVRVEFASGGAVTYAHSLQTTLTEHHQGNLSMIRLSPRSDIKYRIYDDSLKEEIWLHDDPGTHIFDQRAWLEGVTLEQDGAEWRYMRNGAEVGRIPLLWVRGYCAQTDESHTTIAGLAVIPQANGSHILRITVDPVWLAERFAEGCVVVIDPTTVATGNNPFFGVSGRRMCQLADGTLVIAVATSSGTVAYVSKDAGQTWSAVTSPASGIVSSLNGYVAMDVDVDSRVHALIGGNAVNTVMVYQQWTFNAARTEITVVETQAEPADSIRRWDHPDITVWGDAGATKNLAMCYVHVNASDTSSTMYLFTRTAQVTTAGVLTLLTRYTKDSVSRGGDTFHPALSRRSDNSVMLLYSMDATNGGTGFVRVSTISGSVVTIQSGNWLDHVEGIDGFAGFLWAGLQSDSLAMFDDTARLAISAGNWSNQNWNIAATPDAANNRIIFFSKRGSALANPNYPGWFEFNTISNTFTDKGALNTSIAAYNYCIAPRRNFNDSKAHMAYTDAAATNTVYHDAASYNQPPNAPTLTATTNYDATADAVFAWTFSDPDAGNTQSAYQLQIARVDTGAVAVDTGKVASTTSSRNVTGGTLTNGLQYQWRVKTWDNSDVEGPYSSYGTFETSGAPTATVTSPTADGNTITTSKVTAKWSFSDPESGGQSKYRLLLTSSADSLLWDSGEVSSVSARERTADYTLVNSTSYKVKLTVWDDKGISSVQVVRTFSTSFTPPRTPTIALTASAASAKIDVAITNPAPRTNLLAANQSGVETDTTGFSVANGITVSRTTSQFWQGTAGLLAVAPATGDGHAWMPVTVVGAAGKTFTASFYVKADQACASAANATDNATVLIQEDGGGYRFISQAVTLSITTDWQRVILTGTAPADCLDTLRIVLRGGRTTSNVVVNVYYDGFQLEQASDASEWVQGGTGHPAITGNDLYKREVGGSWVRIVSSLAANGSYNDYAVASGVTYEYKVTALGDNDVTTDSTTGSTSITLTDVWLHDVTDPSGTILRLRTNKSRDEKWSPEVSVLRPVGRSKPIVDFGDQEETILTYDLMLLKGNAEWTSLRSLIRRKATLCVRDDAKRKTYGVILELPEADHVWGESVTLKVTEVDYKEEV